MNIYRWNNTDYDIDQITISCNFYSTKFKGILVYAEGNTFRNKSTYQHTYIISYYVLYNQQPFILWKQDMVSIQIYACGLHPNFSTKQLVGNPDNHKGRRKNKKAVFNLNKMITKHYDNDTFVFKIFFTKKLWMKSAVSQQSGNKIQWIWSTSDHGFQFEFEFWVHSTVNLMTVLFL